MKRRLNSLLIVVCIILSALIGLTSCDESPLGTKPPKLSAPIVTLKGNVASWEADANADKYEISIDGELSYVESSVTSKTLTDGQTFKVRAVGDGSSYSTSDWSNSVTYTTIGSDDTTGDNTTNDNTPSSDDITTDDTTTDDTTNDDTTNDTTDDTNNEPNDDAKEAVVIVDEELLRGELAAENGKNGAKITILAYIDNDTSAYFERLEVYDGQTLVLTDNEYEGFAEYYDLNSKTEYTVKLYYASEDQGYTGRVKEVSVTTPAYTLPEIDVYDSESNVVVGKHALFSFNIEKYTDLKYYDVIVRGFTQNDAYFAPFIVEMLDDPTLLDRLQNDSDKHYMRPGGYIWEARYYMDIYLDYLQAWEHKERMGYSDNRWREIAASQDQYIYELSIDNEGLFVANDGDVVYNYYAVLRDYFNYEDLRLEVYLKFDLCDGTGAKEIKLNTAYPYFHKPGDESYGFHIEIDENVKNGYIFTETDYDYKALYVYKIALYKDGEFVCYIPFDVNDITSIDMEAWLEEWIEKLKCGNDQEVADLIEAIPAISFKFIAGTNLAPAGNYELRILYRSILENYDNEDDIKGYSSRNIRIKMDLEAPENIRIEGRRIIWDAVDGADEYVVYVNGEERFTTRDTYYNYGEIQKGDKVKIVATGYYAYDSEPSDEYTFIPPQLGKPTVTVSGRNVSWNSVANATKYVYTVNGVQYETRDTSIYVSSNGTVRIKAVDENGTYLDSEWTSVTVNVGSSGKEK